VSPRVLVTGASGLIGSHVLQAALAAGYGARALARTPLPDDHPCVHETEVVTGDLRDPDALARAMCGCEAVFHVAAVYSYSRARASEMLEVNVDGTRNVLDAAAAAGVARVVVTSSCATCGPVRGRPATEDDEMPAWEHSVPYKRSKLAAERLALTRAAAGQDVVVVNPTTTVGPGDRRPTPSGRMIRDVLDGRIRGYISSGGLNLVGAADVARGHLLALQRGHSGQRYLLGGENLGMGELFRMVASLGGVPAPRLAVPWWVAYAAASLADPLARTFGREPTLLVVDEVRLARLPMHFSSARAERELGYAHEPAQRALTEAVAWFAGAQERPRAGERRWMYSSARSGGAKAPAGGAGSS
jgi:dihydroflavonol-4-reductase